MQTISVHDEVYASLLKHAAASGLSVEEWIRRKTESQDGDLKAEVSREERPGKLELPPLPEDRRPVGELTIEERLARFAEFKKLARNLGGQADFSREANYP